MVFGREPLPACRRKACVVALWRAAGVVDGRWAVSFIFELAGLKLIELEVNRCFVMGRGWV